MEADWVFFYDVTGNASEGSVPTFALLRKLSHLIPGVLVVIEKKGKRWCVDEKYV